MTDNDIHHLMTQTGCGGTLTPAVRRFAQACVELGVAAERERWTLHCAAIGDIAATGGDSPQEVSAALQLIQVMAYVGPPEEDHKPLMMSRDGGKDIPL